MFNKEIRMTAIWYSCSKTKMRKEKDNHKYSYTRYFKNKMQNRKN